MQHPPSRRSWRLGLALGAALIFTIALATLPMPSLATEEPEYQVTRTLGDVELRQYAACTAPEPLDARSRLREVPPRQVAVIRYSGFWSASNYNEHLAQLQAALRAAGLAWQGEPVYSRYNAPFTPWFLRRNEIWLNLAAAP